MTPFRVRTLDRSFARHALVVPLAVALAASALALPALAKEAPKAEGAAAPAPQGPAAAAAIWEKLGLPHYAPPASYSEDVVITSEGRTFTMKRAIDGPKTRTEFAMEKQSTVMIELGDERGTSYQLMPDRKEGIKQSRAAMDEMTGGRMSRMEAEHAGDAAKDAGAPPDMKVEDLGDDTVSGAAARKLRLTSSDGTVLAWFEKATGAPLRMENTSEGKTAVVEWKNRKLEPQPAELFEVPKNYKLTDMDEMVEKMKSMGGMRGMGEGMMSGMMQGMGANMGASFGAGLGASLGGPLGAMAGQYIGGRVGGMIARKATGAGQ